MSEADDGLTKPRPSIGGLPPRLVWEAYPFDWGVEVLSGLPPIPCSSLERALTVLRELLRTC